MARKGNAATSPDNLARLYHLIMVELGTEYDEHGRVVIQRADRPAHARKMKRLCPRVRIRAAEVGVVGVESRDFERTIREAIAHGSDGGKIPLVLGCPRGYFVTSDPDEIGRAIGYLYKYLAHTREHIDNLERAKAAAIGSGQQPLF